MQHLFVLVCASVLGSCSTSVNLFCVGSVLLLVLVIRLSVAGHSSISSSLKGNRYESVIDKQYKLWMRGLSYNKESTLEYLLTVSKPKTLSLNPEEP